MNETPSATVRWAFFVLGHQRRWRARLDTDLDGGTVTASDTAIWRHVGRCDPTKPLAHWLPNVYKNIYKKSCPARIRTWVRGAKVLCATTTPPGSI